MRSPPRPRDLSKRIRTAETLAKIPADTLPLSKRRMDTAPKDSTAIVPGLVTEADADLTLQDFSEGLGWLIANFHAGGVSIEDQIMMLQSALDALRAQFTR